MTNTPEFRYGNAAAGYGYSVERFTYQRRADQGVSLLMVEVSLKEVRPVTAIYEIVQIVNPQNGAATPQQSNGSVQAPAPDQSVLTQWSNQAHSLYTNTLLPMFSGSG
jgi:hypothetical protein